MRDVAPLAQGQPAIEIVLGQAVIRFAEGTPELFGVPLLADRGEQGHHHRGREQHGGQSDGPGQRGVAHRPQPAPLHSPHRPCPARFAMQVTTQVRGQFSAPCRIAAMATWRGPSGRWSRGRAECGRSTAEAAGDPHAAAGE